jgi:uncharacterized protein YjbI with pentapeptide repeats
MSWAEHHKQSEFYANEADTALIRGEAERAARLYCLAAEAEVAALNELDPSKARTLGITAVSATALWYKSGNYQQSKLFANQSLKKYNLPPFAVHQLENISEKINESLIQNSIYQESFKEQNIQLFNSLSVDHQDIESSDLVFSILTDFSEESLKRFVEQLIPSHLSINKIAVLRTKLIQLIFKTNETERIQPLISSITESVDSFLDLLAIAELNLSKDFNWSDLSRVNLSEINLSGASFSGANLSEAKLHRVNLSQANLDMAVLIRSDLSEAKLNGARLSSAVMIQSHLVKTDLSGADLSGADLSNADLSGAILYEADLRDANLRGANLSGADFRKTTVENARFISSTGIILELKNDLQYRGAIFEDSFGDGERVLSAC